MRSSVGGWVCSVSHMYACWGEGHQSFAVGSTPPPIIRSAPARHRPPPATRRSSKIDLAAAPQASSQGLTSTSRARTPWCCCFVRRLTVRDHDHIDIDTAASSTCHKPTTITATNDDRALHGSVPLSPRTSTSLYPTSRLVRFLTVADHTTTIHLPTRSRGPRRSKTEPGRQAWRFTPLQRIPNPGRSPGRNPDSQPQISSAVALPAA
jgi:hypothetical protein